MLSRDTSNHSTTGQSSGTAPAEFTDRLKASVEKAKIDYDTRIQRHESVTTAGEETAVAFLEEVFGGPWRELLSSSKFTLPNCSRLHKIDLLLGSKLDGVTVKLGTLFVVGMARPNNFTPARREDLTHIVAAIASSCQNATSFADNDPIVQKCCQAVRASAWGMISVNTLLFELFGNHPACQPCSDIFVAVSSLDLLNQFKTEFAELVETVTKIILSASGSECRAGFRSVCDWITCGAVSISSPTEDRAQRLQQFCDVGSALIAAISTLPVAEILGSLRGMCAMGNEDLGRPLAFTLAERDERGHFIVEFSHHTARKIGVLIYDKPALTRQVAAEISAIPEPQKRQDFLLWVLDYPMYGELSWLLKRHSQSSEGLTIIRNCCREDPHLIGELMGAIEDRPVRAALLCELAALGEATLCDQTTRQQVFDFADRNPGLAPRLVKAWVEYMRSGDTNKATVITYLWTLQAIETREIDSFLRLLTAISDEMSLPIIADITQHKKLPALIKTAKALAHVARATTTLNSPRRADPLTIRLGNLRQLGFQDLGNEIERCVLAHPTLRRAFNDVISDLGPTHAVPVLTAMVSPTGLDLVSRLFTLLPLRRAFPEFIRRDPAHAAQVITVGYATENWTNICQQVLPPQTLAQLTDDLTLADRPGTRRNDNFGAWQGLSRVLIVGGELSLEAQKKLCDSLPGIRIEFFSAYNTGAAAAQFKGNFDVYIAMTRRLRHDIEILARQARQRSQAKWLYFDYASVKILTRELQLRFGMSGSTEEGGIN